MIKKLFILIASFAVFGAAGFAVNQSRPTLEYFGQSCFMLTTASGARIVIDPHNKLSYPLPQSTADVVTVSHEHFDHNNVDAIKGNPIVLRGLKPDGSWNGVDQTIKGVHIYNVGVFHDSQQGAKRGRDSVFVFEFDGLRLVHLGDLGHLLDQEQVKKIGKPDFLLIPIGGYYTIDEAQAWRVIGQLSPKVIIPMHYKTSKTSDLPISTLDVFLKGHKNVKQLASTVADLVAPASQEVWVFKTP